MVEPMIRPERPGDAAAISALLEAAFGGPEEARLVEKLRADSDLTLSLVAEDDGAVIGHVAFSPLACPGARLFALAPLAVAESSRRRGIGARLVEAGLAELRARGATGSVVLGDPAFYRRFGFSAEAAAGLVCAWSGPYLQALAFEGPAPEGRLEYAPAFAGL